MPSIASSRELHEAYSFRVSVQGFADGLLFQDAGPIESSISVSTFREAGSVLEVSAPDGVSFSDVTLTRGASRSRAIRNWFQNTVAALAGLSNGRPIPGSYLRTVQIVQLDRPKKSLKRYTLYEAYPVHIREGAWNNAVDEIVIESITLKYKYNTLQITGQG